MLEIFRIKEGDAVRVQQDDLRRVVQAIFEKLGATVENSKLAADVLKPVIPGDQACCPITLVL